MSASSCVAQLVEHGVTTAPVRAVIPMLRMQALTVLYAACLMILPTTCCNMFLMNRNVTHMHTHTHTHTRTRTRTHTHKSINLHLPCLPSPCDNTMQQSTRQRATRKKYAKIQIIKERKATSPWPCSQRSCSPSASISATCLMASAVL